MCYVNGILSTEMHSCSCMFVFDSFDEIEPMKSWFVCCWCNELQILWMPCTGNLYAIFCNIINFFQLNTHKQNSGSL